MRKLFLVSFAALAGLAPLPWAEAQQPPASPQKEASKPKAKKVWTDEDIRALRTPADDYAGQKQATKQGTEQAAAAQPDPATKPAAAKKEQITTRDPFVPPKTAEEAQTRLAQKREEIRGQQELIQQKREEYFEETNEAIRLDLKKSLDRLTADLREAEVHMRLLESSLERLGSEAQPPRL